MGSLVKESVEYLAGQMANITKETDTANGNTDDKNEGQPTQVDLIQAGTTDARDIANDVFKGKVLIPAVLIVGGDAYDVTQSYTRMNKLYNMGRGDFYKQSEQAQQTRKNRLAVKQELISAVSRQSEEPKKLLEQAAQ